MRSLSKWSLGTADSHSLDRKFGFSEVKYPECLMEKWGDNAR